MKKLLLAAVGIVALSAPAFAADLPARTYSKAPMMVEPAFTWTGFYVGGFVGGAWSNGNASVSDPCLVGVACPVVGTFNGVPPTVFTPGSSFLGGGTIGYNWQTGAAVFGLEAEGGYMRLRGSRVQNPLAGADTLASTTLGNGYAVFAGRLGWASDRALFYVKGGGVWTRATNGVVDTTVVTINSTTSHDSWGWAVGAGVEYALSNNWSIKGEYLYLGVDRTFTDQGVVLPGGAIDNVVSHDPGIHTAKIGVNYRFGGPVVARY